QVWGVRPALVLVDFAAAYFVENSPLFGGEGCVRARDSAARLLAGARAAGVPIIFVRIAFRPDYADVPRNCDLYRAVAANQAVAEGSWGAEFHEQLAPQPGEWIVTHNRVNAFYSSQLEGQLTALGVGRLIVAGVATNSVVEHTVRHAADMGYEIVIAQDACSCAPYAAHEASLAAVANLATLSVVDEIFPRKA
ncbi:MAG: cysteine hydrolase, partial [Pseudomonadota bacterium]